MEYLFLLIFTLVFFVFAIIGLLYREHKIKEDLKEREYMLRYFMNKDKDNDNT